MRPLFRLIACLYISASLPLVGRADEMRVSFNRDVRPLLAGKCFACHGPDEEAREADLRLDNFDAAVAYGAIVPSKPEESLLLERVDTEDPDLVMPPADSGESLSAEEKDLLRRWIADGARYESHWAFIPPEKPPLPEVTDTRWPRNEIDFFVLSRMEQAGLAPAPEADRYSLIRRVSLDLIGLPPTPEEADAFVHDTHPQAYERLVERLLKSSHYGERWAREWLDLARYSDTNGYEKDRSRSIWPYRDWVIKALNDDLPFDQFTIEQLAGDMLPDATLSQRVATGFHRNTMLNEEGGIDPLEYRFYAMVDRVATTGTIWFGLTTGCVQCHSHKYDPLTQTDYYRLMALLNNADEPDLLVPQPEMIRRRDEINAQIAELEADLPDHFPPSEGEEPLEERRTRNLEQKFNDWLITVRPQTTDWEILRPVKMTTNLPRLEILEDGSLFSSGDITKRDLFTLTFELGDFDGPITALRLEVLPDDRLPAGGPGRAYYEGRKGDFFLSELNATRQGESVEFGAASASFGKISVGSGSADAENLFDGDGSTGWSTSGREGERHQLVVNLDKPLISDGELVITLLFERHFAASLGRFRISATSRTEPSQASELPVEIESLLAQDTLSEPDRAHLREHYLKTCPELADARRPIEELLKQLPESPSTMVFQERPHDNPRATFSASSRRIFESARAGDARDPRSLHVRWPAATRQPPGIRPVVGQRPESTGGAGDGESCVAVSAWKRSCADRGGLWNTGGTADASATLGLAGVRIRRPRLVTEVAASSHRDECHLPAELEDLSVAQRTGSGESVAGSRSSTSRPCGNGSRHHVAFQQSPLPEDVRTERLSTSTGVCDGPRLRQHGLESVFGRGSLPALTLHVQQADGSLRGILGV